MTAREDNDWTVEQEAELLGLTAREAAWLEVARMACELLNESLEHNHSALRWNMLYNSDPRRKRKR